MITLQKGRKIWKSDLKGELHRIKMSKFSAMEAFAMLERAGYIECRGKIIIVKKDMRF